LATRHPRILVDGRPATPVEVILRMLVIKHLYHWSFQHTQQWVSDSLVLRQFCRVHAERVPDDTTLLRWANCIQSSTMHSLLDQMIDLARQAKVTRGRKLRINGTLVATNIHHPTDSSLLGDGVQELSRTLKRAQQVLRDVTTLGQDAFRNRTRSAKRHIKRIEDAIRQRGEQAAATWQTAYRHLIRITTQIVQQAQMVSKSARPRRSSACSSRMPPVSAKTNGRATPCLIA
jgi:IS5 family transposase